MVYQYEKMIIMKKYKDIKNNILTYLIYLLYLI